MIKPKLLHISLGSHNEGMWRAFDKEFNTLHFDWTENRNDLIRLNLKIIELFNFFNPDIVFMQIQDAGIISMDTAKYLTKKSVTINWTGDVRHPIPYWYNLLGQNIDITLFSNINDVDTLNKQGVNAGFLQVGFDETLFTPEGNKNHYPQIVFLGSNYSSELNFPLSELRRQMVSRLNSKYGAKFMAYGHNWQNVIGREQFLHPLQEAEAYRSSLIAINLSHFDYGRYSSDRMLRLMGSGGFCLSHNFCDISKDYEVGTHLDTWGNIEQLLCKIDFYLENNELREKIRKTGCEFVRENYTWDKVMIELKKIIGY